MLRIDNNHQINGNKLIAGLTSSKVDRAISTSIKILVVEDNPLNQKIAKINLEMLGYEVDIAKNGQETLAMFDQGYALILMDVGLPDMDGLEITRYIRQQEEDSGKHITIVAATANGEGYRQKCLDAGMDDFLNKPFMPNELKAMLDKYIY